MLSFGQRKIVHLHTLYTCVHNLLLIHIHVHGPYDIEDTVKPTNVVASIKKSPLLKGHLFLVLS
jgi:hypothetical protein